MSDESFKIAGGGVLWGYEVDRARKAFGGGT